MRSHLLLISAALGLLAAPLLAQTSKGKKTLKKKAVATASQKSGPAIPTATPTQPPFQPMAEPTREGVVTEAKVFNLDGTIMVQHTDQSAPTALQTGSTVEKGDEITVHDGAWVIFKTRNGDYIGLANEALASFEEYYFEGPDRQIRIVLRQGSLYLKTGNADSRQSFFEVQAGSQVVSIGDVEAKLDLDPGTGRLTVQYFNGKMRVIDTESEKKITAEATENIWENGKMITGEGSTMDEMAFLNFNRFWDFKDPLVDASRDILLGTGDALRQSVPVVGSEVDQKLTEGFGSAHEKEAHSLYKQGLAALKKNDPSAAKYCFEQSLALAPNFPRPKAALEGLRSKNPELFADQDKNAKVAYEDGERAYQKKDYAGAKRSWEKTLNILPSHTKARLRLDKLRTEHPELK